MEPDIFKSLIAAFIAFLAVVVLVPSFRLLAVNSGFVDRPGGRKDHEELVPPIGGLLIFPVYVILALAAGMDIEAYWPLISAIMLLGITGALDDYMDIKASVKFLIQFIAAFLIVVPGGAVIDNLGNLFGTGPLTTGFAALPFTIFCVMLLINAVNMMDGLDGLAGGNGLAVLFWLAVALTVSGEAGMQLVYVLLLAGTLAGFLYYNIRSPVNRRATVFLGDSGSMALGLVLAWFCIKLSQPPHQALAPISVAWIIALPVIDAFGLFVIRIFSGRHPFSADRLHFHHNFVHAGLSAGKSTMLILATGFLLGLAGYAGVLAGIPKYVLTYAWIVLLVLHTLLKLNSQHFISFLEKLFSR